MKQQIYNYLISTTYNYKSINLKVHQMCLYFGVADRSGYLYLHYFKFAVTLLLPCNLSMMIVVCIDSMRILPIIFTSCILIFITGCASMKPSDFEKGNSTADPIQFFIGKTTSDGVVENRAGKPITRIKTETVGTIQDSIIQIEQDLYPEGGNKNHRSWQLRQIDKHHVDATANDIDGTAHGLLYGNHFSWTFRLKLTQRKFIKHLRMSQNMYLMPDGNSMIIRSVLRKFGIVVVQITEEFQKN